MLNVCLRYSHDRDEAEDILQEGFIKVFRHLHTFKKSGTLENWIRRIMVNEAINLIRKNKKQQMFEYIDEINENEIPEPFESMQVLTTPPAEVLMSMIQSLSPGYRMIFNLFVFEEFSHKEIASQLGISENTSKTQLRKARKALIKMLLTKKQIMPIVVHHG